MFLRFHVGCGTVYLEDYVNLDLVAPGTSLRVRDTIHFRPVAIAPGAP